MLAHMTSAELTAWQALFAVKAEEQQQARDVAESGDGRVFVSGRDDDEDDEEEADDDGG